MQVPIASDRGDVTLVDWPVRCKRYAGVLRGDTRLLVACSYRLEARSFLQYAGLALGAEARPAVSATDVNLDPKRKITEDIAAAPATTLPALPWDTLLVPKAL
ncbi:MAG: hypothetical protein BGO82_01310 [Devosia sp. 67-54]|nr:MAG: hypothetical protein BGO82_01310 [Devosia sp. 67-54]